MDKSWFIPEEINYKEIVQTLIGFVDLDNLILLYQPMKEFIDYPPTLRRLSLQFQVPYEITRLVKGKPTTVRFINNFSDLVLSVRLRDPEERDMICLSFNAKMKIAIFEEDVKLFKDLSFQKAEEILSPAFWKLAGEIGNREIINLLLDNSGTHKQQRRGPILEGLAKNHHNQLTEKYISQFCPKHVSQLRPKYLAKSLYYGIVAGDNLELFVKYQPLIAADLVYLAGYHRSKKILEQWLEKILGDREFLHKLFSGYIMGGHLEEAKRVYKMLDGEVSLSSQVLPENCIECVLYLEELGLLNSELINSILETGVTKLTPVLKFLVERDSDLAETLFFRLLTSDDTAGIIWVYEKFHHLPNIASKVTQLRMGKKYSSYNKCFVQWLTSQHE
ncbi:Hypothetical protein POVR1_LOCUS86 [uncultured virus]|nr:Hypothetical protein POVR1_LOCUS86 [uncultured virus]